MDNKELDTPGKRMTFARKAEGFHSRSDFAKALGIADSTLQSFENSPDPNRTFKQMQEAAEKLNYRQKWLAKGTGAPKTPPQRFLDQANQAFGDQIRVEGLVAAGLWAENDGLNQDDDEYISAGPDPRYSGQRHFALKVLGNSMNRIFRSGSYVICVEPPSSEGWMPQHNQFVVVERRRAQGGEKEVTVKRVSIQNDEYLLMPMSDDPAFQDPITYKDRSAEEGTDVIVVGCVAFSINFV